MYNIGGSIVVIEPFAPWKSHLFDLEKELNLNNQELKYAMYKDSMVGSHGSWRSKFGLNSEFKYLYMYI